MLRTKQRRLLFIVVLGVGLFLALPKGPAVAVTADGRRIAIEKITFGTHHSFTQGKWWVRVLKPILGKRWAAQRGYDQTHITNDVPALVVWTRWENIDKSRSVGIEATLLDQRGNESELILYYWHAAPVPHPADPRPYEARVAWLVKNYPRHSKALRLRVYDRDKGDVLTQAVEIAFSNPASRWFRNWNGFELPLMVTTNNTQFTLTSVEKTSNALWRLDFNARAYGVIDPSWLVGGVTASSASGNLLMSRSNLAAMRATNLAFQLRGALWPEEPVWRFAAEFYRIGDFQPAELWTLTNIAIPSRNLPFHLKTNIAVSVSADQPLELILQCSPYRSGGIRRNANVYVHFAAPDRHLFLAGATDDQGRPIKFEVDPGAPRMAYVFGLSVPTNVQSINLTFAICRPTVVVFDVATGSFTGTEPR